MTGDSGTLSSRAVRGAVRRTYALVGDQRLRGGLRRIPGLRAAYVEARAALERRESLRIPDFAAMAPAPAVRIAYQVLLGRDPDPTGQAESVADIVNGHIDPPRLADRIRASEEFLLRVKFRGTEIGPSLHAARCEFIRSLPPGRRILDLGGTHRTLNYGALLSGGYPYRFEELVILDLLPEDRNDIYRTGLNPPETVHTPAGPVRYVYGSMADLSAFADASMDLVYSGQSIEHVTPAEGRRVLEEVARVLRPGGHLALDTPNGRVTRLQQDDFIDPDHKVEYTLPELLDLIDGTGLDVREVKGLNYAGDSLASGRFDAEEVVGNSGIFAAAEDCYVLCVVCRKPGGPPTAEPVLPGGIHRRR